MANEPIRVRLGDNNVDLPSDDLAKQLAAAGFDRSPRQVRLNEVEYLPLNEQGKELLMKCSPYESLATANLACSLLAVPDIDAPMQEVMNSTHRLLTPMPTEPMSFYCPLTVRVEEDDDLVEGDPFLLREYEDTISDFLRNEAVPAGDDMARHMRRCSQSLQDKMASAVWDVGKCGGQIYGIIHCELYAPLTADEKTELADWIQAQNFDGLGESIEQTPIATTEGDIYVSFGNSDPGYFVYDREQFEAYLNGGMPEMEPEADLDQGFGGMGGMA